ncbi:MAG: DJ-1/PfpI family protein [Solirubrobacterales bacterium]|nr:DJ-1/PfpI family protein [Solirubrobacterales bacterium]
MEIAIPLYDRFTALDAIGPYEVLGRLPGAQVRFIAHEAGPVTTDTRMLTLVAEARLEDVAAPDVLLVPGGGGARALLEDERMLAWIRGAHETSTWTTSVCTGSLLLAAAGVLDGLEATTHWAARDQLESLGARPAARRVVRQDKVVTAAGVSAGIDMALTLAGLIAGEDLARAIQLGIEYDPQPPFGAGSPEGAGPDLVALVRQGIDAAERERA